MKKIVREPKTNIPSGMAIHLPEGAGLRRHAQEIILRTFLKWGYREVVTPVFEYLDVLSAGLSSGLIEKSYKFVDRESGKLMLMRPDITPQVARMAAGILADEPKPLRLCYCGNVFRYEESHAGREREMFQVGCELIGAASPKADAEIIAVASDALKEAGIEDFKIVIGHIGYLYGIISFLRDFSGQDFSHDVEQSLQDAIVKKDIGLIETVLDSMGIKGERKGKILQIPGLFGGKEILDKAVRVSGNEDSLAAIENLRQVYSELCLYQLTDYILFDLCDIRGIDYYTGLFFEVFATGMAYPISRGGRYDNLIGRFGKECPSIGFAVDIESIIMAKERQGKLSTPDGINYLIIEENNDKKRSIELARALRKKGYSVIMDMGFQDVDTAVTYARKNNIGSVIVIEDKEGKKKKHFSVINLKTGEKTMVKNLVYK